MTAQLVFWIAVGLLVYTYAGYHFLLRVVALFMPSDDSLNSSGPADCIPVSIIVAVHNEETVIERRIENLLRLDYPREKLDIIIASDGCSDRTNEIAQRYAAQGVKLLALDRVGKGPAQDFAVLESKGKILILTDADSEFEPDFVRATVSHFLRDARVGALAANVEWTILSKFNPPSRLRELS